MNAHQEIEPTKEKINYKEQIGKIWINIPFFIKSYFIITIILYILNLKIKSISFYLINIPFYTVFHFQLWRLITSVFITTNIFHIILAFFIWVKYASLLEISLGTIKYTLVFFINSICIQIINIFIFSIFSLLSKNSFNSKTKSKNNSGLWGIVMCEMTLLCFSNPESPMKLLLIPFTVKAKIYPAILVAIFLTVNFLEIDIEIISGIIYGLIYFYFLKIKLQISDVFIQKLENKAFFKWMCSIKGFISVTHISNGLPISITNLEQEKEKLKGKGVVVSGSLYNIKEDDHQKINQASSIVEENLN